MECVHLIYGCFLECTLLGWIEISIGFLEENELGRIKSKKDKQKGIYQNKNQTKPIPTPAGLSGGKDFVTDILGEKTA